MTLSKVEQARRAEVRDGAIVELRKALKPGDDVACVLTHVSRSGMSRSIKVILPGDGGRHVWDASYLVARAVGWTFDRNHGGVKVDGCGMDMGFHLVYTLSRILYPDGYECHERRDGEGYIVDRCYSNDHSNRDDRAHHPDGGYALRSTWI